MPALVAAANVPETPQLPEAAMPVDQSTPAIASTQAAPDPGDADVSSNEVDYDHEETAVTEPDVRDDEAPAEEDEEPHPETADEWNVHPETADEWNVLDSRGRRMRPVRVIAPSEERYDSEEDDRIQRNERMSKILSWQEVNDLTKTQVRDRNQHASPMSQSEWRFDSYKGIAETGEESELFEICRSFNNPMGQFWCRNSSEKFMNKPGHNAENPLLACRSGSKIRVHVCCRCRQPGHPWSLCETKDKELDRSHFDFATKPPKPLDIREEDNQARWDRYGIPAENKPPWKASSSSSRGW